MKKFFATLFAVAVCLVNSSAHAVPVANYDMTTGGITFVDVASIVGLRLNELTPAPGLDAGAPTDLGGAAGCATFCVVNDQSALNPGFIEWGNLLGMTFASAAAGNLMPTSLTQGNLDSGYQFIYRTVAQPTVNVTGQILCTNCGVVTNQPPVLQDDPAQGTGLNRTFMHQFTVLQDDMLPTPGLTWSIQSFSGGPAPNAPSIDGSGKLSWNTTGAQGGGTLYTAVVRATDNGQLFDETSLVIKVPEPGTMVLAGLSLIGIVTSRRRLS